MQSFNVTSLVAESKTRQQVWMEFLRVDALSMGFYRLKAGQPDPQQPHTEDEVYYVVAGKAWFRAGEQEQAVGPGSVIFVEQLVDHRFFDITEDLTVLVCFVPPEGSQQKA